MFLFFYVLLYLGNKDTSYLIRLFKDVSLKEDENIIYLQEYDLVSFYYLVYKGLDSKYFQLCRPYIPLLISLL